jgi:hypothetical protein
MLAAAGSGPAFAWEFAGLLWHPAASANALEIAIALSARRIVVLVLVMATCIRSAPGGSPGLLEHAPYDQYKPVGFV